MDREHKNIPMKTKRTLRYWKTLSESKGAIIEDLRKQLSELKNALEYSNSEAKNAMADKIALQQDLFRAHADTEMVQAQLKQQEDISTKYMGQVERLNNLNAELGNRCQGLQDDLQTVKANEEKAIDYANGMSEERDTLKSRLEEFRCCDNGYFFDNHKCQKVCLSGPPPRVSWGWKNFMIPAILGVCLMAAGYYEGLNYSKPKPVPQTTWIDTTRKQLADAVVSHLHRENDIMLHDLTVLKKEHAIRLEAQQDYRQQQETIKACKEVEKRHGEIER